MRSRKRSVKRAGVIFDWDGVIVDSSRLHELSWEALAMEEGRELPSGHFKAGFGRKNDHIIPNILGWNVSADEIVRMGRRKEELYRGMIGGSGIMPLPGVVEFLNRLETAGISSVIGSSTERRNIETILDAIGLRRHFSAIVAAEDVTRGKPDPQVFLLAAARLGKPPRDCIVFEDSYAGLEAAHAGGMKSVGVATTHPAEALRDRADRVVARLDELAVAEVEALITG